MKFRVQKNGLSAPKIISKNDFIEITGELLYADPSLITSFGSLYYLCDRDPVSNELDILDPANNGVGVYVNIPDFIYPWFNQVSKEIFWCTDNTFNAMVWHHLASNINISSILNTLGFAPVAISPWSQIIDADFGVSRQPNLSCPTEVSVNIQYASLLSLSAQTQLSISETLNGTYVPISKDKRQISVAANELRNLSCTVPPGHCYKIELIDGGSQVTIDSVYELTK